MHKELLRRTMQSMLPDRIRLRPKTPLRGDPLICQVESKRWSPLPLPSPIEAIHEFVDWEKFSAALESKSQASLWIDLQPLSLLYWLKSIENSDSFQ